MPTQITLFLTGDVMTGRGVDQVLSSPGDPQLWEAYAHDARDYVRLAEAAHGPIPRSAPPDWPWGDVLAELDRTAPHARLINLETAITPDGQPCAGKDVLYRMHPDNLACLTVARPDVCVLANNHVLDFGPQGLTDTISSLAKASLTTAGAGHNEAQAWQPAIVPVADGRLLLFAAATTSSGVPSTWAAGENSPGVAYLPDLSDDTADMVTGHVDRARRPGDIVVMSIHWGSNWGYTVPPTQVRFAHRLVDHGVHMVYGHSSHHPRPFEIYHGRLILYGCGDFIDDYEGIGGHEQYRDDLRPAYLTNLDPTQGQLTRLRIVIFQSHRMRLTRASPHDVTHVMRTLNHTGREWGSHVDIDPDGSLIAHLPT